MKASNRSYYFAFFSIFLILTSCSPYKPPLNKRYFYEKPRNIGIHFELANPNVKCVEENDRKFDPLKTVIDGLFFNLRKHVTKADSINETKERIKTFTFKNLKKLNTNEIKRIDPFHEKDIRFSKKEISLKDKIYYFNRDLRELKSKGFDAIFFVKSNHGLVIDETSYPHQYLYLNLDYTVVDTEDNKIQLERSCNIKLPVLGKLRQKPDYPRLVEGLDSVVNLCNKKLTEELLLE